MVKPSKASKGRKREIVQTNSSSTENAGDKEIENLAPSKTTVEVELTRPRTRRQQTKKKRFS